MANDEAKPATGGRILDRRSHAVFGDSRCSFPGSAEMIGMIPRDMIPTEGEGIPSADGFRFTTVKPLVPYTTEAKLKINRKTTIIRFENENEEGDTTIVIEPKV